MIHTVYRQDGYRFAEVADQLETYLDRIAWETYVPSEQRTAGQLVDHIAWAWEAESAAFRAIAALVFDSMEAFERAFTPFAGEIQADIPRYTNIAPTIQISEVKL